MMMGMIPAMPPRSNFLDDFANRNTGNLFTQGWTNVLINGTGSATVVVDNTALSGRRVTLTKLTGSSWYGIAMDSIGSRADIEILIRMSFPVAANPENGTLYLRGTPGQPGGTVVRFYGPSTLNAASLRNRFVMQYDNDAELFPVVGSVAFVPTPNVWYWVRFRLVGLAASAKFWQHGTAEPNWQISGNIPAGLTASGIAELLVFDAGTNFYFDFFSAAFNGATAPSPQG